MIKGILRIKTPNGIDLHIIDNFFNLKVILLDGEKKREFLFRDIKEDSELGHHIETVDGSRIKVRTLDIPYIKEFFSEYKKSLKRRQQVIGGIAAVVLLIIFVIFANSSNKGGVVTKAKASADTEASARAAADESVAAKASMDADRTLMLAFKTQFYAATDICDRSAKAVSDISKKTNDPYELYPVVLDAKSSCYDSANEVRKLSIPDFSDYDLRASLKKTRDTCVEAIQTKAYAYSSMSDVLDGNVSPSKVTEVKQANEVASYGQNQCYALFFTDAVKTGMTLDQLKPE